MLTQPGTRIDVEQPVLESLSMSRVSTLVESNAGLAANYPMADGAAAEGQCTKEQPGAPMIKIENNVEET